MAKLKLQRIELVAPLSQRKKIIEYLQRRGVVELTDRADEGLQKMDTAGSVAQFENARGIALAAQSVLHDYVPAKKGMFASFAGKHVWKTDDFGLQVKKIDDYLRVCRDINARRAAITQAKAGVVRATMQIDQLQAWQAFDLPLDFEGTASTTAFIGTVPGLYKSDLLAEQLGAPAEVEVLYAAAEQSNVFVLCHKANEAEVYAALRERGFAALSGGNLSPAEQSAQYTGAIAAYTAEIEQSEAAIRGYADFMQNIEFLLDYFDMRAQKYEALQSLAMTQNVFIAEGYIPEKYAAQITAELEQKYTIAIEITEPDAEDDVPVLLQNNAFVAPVESVTAMYALPAKDDIDPNPVMAFFYYFFFGLMLSDAGYGLLLVLGCGFALWKLNLTRRMRNNMKMFLYCGISTIFWGAMFGSWFGDIIPVIFTQFLHRPAPQLAIWMDPVANTMKLLLVCFGLGIVHLFAGVGANFYKLWKAGQKFDALCESIPVYLTILGVAPIAAGILTTVPAYLSNYGKYFALAGVVLIVLTAGRANKGIIKKLSGGLGLNGLYGIIAGYLGDIISYSRLLALGLCTGIIAGVVNMLGALPSNPALKAVLLAVVFVLGHALNMAINVLGAYVHTNRLQFVEMFGKFYSGGGRAYEPFKMKTKYITFKEDLLND